MKNTTYTFDKAPDYTPQYQQIPGLNAPAIDYNLLKNLP